MISKMIHRWHNHIPIIQENLQGSYCIELINEFSRVAGYKINTQNLVVFLYSTSEQSKKEILFHLQFHL